MKEVVLNIPTLEAEQNIEIEVKINGKKKKLFYKVEIIDFETNGDESASKVDILKRVIKEQSKDWKLVQIGAPGKKRIPVMFKKK